MNEVYQMLKKNGLILEEMLNNYIHKQLNKEEAINLVKNQSEPLAHAIKKFQETMDTISIPLNIPTKKDVANAIRVSMQIEEKVDQLETRIIELQNSLEELKRMAARQKLDEADSDKEKIMPASVKDVVDIHDARRRRQARLLKILNSLQTGAEKIGT